MPDPQAVCQFGGLPIIGGEVTLSRGVHPSVFRLRTSPGTGLPPVVGDLTLGFDGTTITFPNCATGSHVQRVYRGRIPYTWSHLVYDRRWTWHWPRVSGEYNVPLPNGELRPETVASLTELLEKCLESLGETSNTLVNIPDVFPHVKWQQNYAARELEWLCETAGLAICPHATGVLIEPIRSGVTLPPPSPGFNMSELFSAQPATVPEDVVVVTGPNVYQTSLALEAVGLDTDGEWKPLDDLSYTPFGGWGLTWYTTFADVDASVRWLAFQTVWRCYRVVPDALVGNRLVGSLRQYRLLEKLAEAQNDSLGIGRPLDATVWGEFWSGSDLRVNVSDYYSGSFRIRPELHQVQFEYPVIGWSGGVPAAANISLVTSYTMSDDDDGEWVLAFSRNVPESVTGTPPRIDKRRHLQRVQNLAPVFQASASDNFPAVQTEANRYLDRLSTVYGGVEADMLYGGLVPISLSGQVAQVMYRWGNTRVATTRASQNMEFDTSTLSHQERRRRDRLGQIADKVGV